MNVYIGRTGKHGQVPGSRDPLEAKEVATRRKTRQRFQLKRLGIVNISLFIEWEYCELFSY